MERLTKLCTDSDPRNCEGILCPSHRSELKVEMKKMIRLTAQTRWMKRAACAALALAATASAQQFELKDGDTVVFYGDSITAQHFYTRFVEDFVLTRYPALHMHFVNAGDLAVQRSTPTSKRDIALSLMRCIRLLLTRRSR